MELAFITSAVRRYFWVVLLFMALGAVPAVLLKSDDAAMYQSRAVLLVTPPSDGSASYASEPDRYVVNQLSVLRSDELAVSVAAAVGGGASAQVVQSAVSFDHRPKTDVVEVVVETTDPAFSQAIGNAYIDRYLDLLETQTSEVVGPLDTELEGINAELATNAAAQAALLTPYLQAEPAAAGEAYPPIPVIEQLSPDLAAQYEVLVARYNVLLEQRGRVDMTARLNASGKIVQRATMPAAPETSSDKLLLAMGVVGGGFVGFLAAVVMARLSPRVLDNTQAEEILGVQVFGSLPSERMLANHHRAALEEPPPSVITFIESLCVQIESGAQRADTLTVAVVGTQRSSGVTTLASAVASQFAANGSSVLLVDADQRHPELTSLFGNPRPDAPENRPRRSPTGKFVAAPKRLHRFNTTIVPNLNVVSFSGGPSNSTMRRQHVDEAVSEAMAQADVVVFDGGPLMAASSTVQLSRLCDAVILTIPGRQNVRPLAAAAAALRNRSFLAVSTPSGHTSLRLPAP